MKLYSKTWSTEGPPLVILHGLFGNQGNWAWHARQLADEFAVYGMDLRNHGRSGQGAPHDYPTMAADVQETLAQLGLEKVSVLGHSMGGKTAMELALQMPRLIERLIVVDIAPVSYVREDFAPLRAMQSLDLNTVTTRSDADARMAEIIDDRAVRDFLLTNLQRDTGGRYSWRCNLDVLADSYTAIKGFPDPVSQFDGPTLFIKGGLSSYLLPEHADTVTGLFPAAQVKIVSSAGHWVHSEKPQAFMKLIQDFLRQA